MVTSSPGSRCGQSTVLPWGQYGILVLALVFLLLNFHVVVVKTQPLEREGRDVDEEQTPPSQPPASFNGFFSIHALNLTSVEAVTGTFGSETLSPEDPSEFLTLSRDTTLHPFTAESENFNHLSGAYIDSSVENEYTNISPNDLVTSPKIEVLSKTIATDQTISDKQSFENKLDPDEKSQRIKPTTTTKFQETRPTVASGGRASSSGEALQSGGETNTVEADVDIFDSLMSSIHNHWSDFVGKMKLSVLDVWKSISNHMMDRLENFATTL